MIFLPSPTSNNHGSGQPPFLKRNLVLPGVNVRMLLGEKIVPTLLLRAGGSQAQVCCCGEPQRATFARERSRSSSRHRGPAGGRRRKCPVVLGSVGQENMLMDQPRAFSFGKTCQVYIFCCGSLENLRTVLRPGEQGGKPCPKRII